MIYYSTRDKAMRMSGTEAILQGLSPDGGLFVPEFIPQLSETELRALLRGRYADIAEDIVGRFLPEIGREALRGYIGAAYGASKWGGGEPAPVARLGERTYMLELWHGPTCAFKDVALQLLPHLLTHSLEMHRPGARAAILVATSGDTGKAALEGFCGVPGTQIMVFYPVEGVSPLQALQMRTQRGGNLSVVAVQGNFDDAQTGVKAIFGDESLCGEIAGGGVFLSSANSINWGRLLPQIVYYFSAYASLVEGGEITFGDAVDVAVPTGNFGNILAAHYAKRMGLAVGRLICASNQNDVLTEFLRTGRYNSRRPFYATISPSMDILVSSNLERLLFALSGEDDACVRSLYAQLRAAGAFAVDGPIAAKLQSEFFAASATEAETEAQIKNTFERYGYLVDPHTAVALKAVAAAGGDRPVIVAATASGYKFPRSVLRALTGAAPDDEFEAAEALSALTGTEIPPEIAGLRGAAPRFEAVCAPEGMRDAARAFILGEFPR